MATRPAAVAGSWYPGNATKLGNAVQQHLDSADTGTTTRPANGDLLALIAPHAGLIYSGPVAAHGYRLLRGRAYDAIVLVGPSHYVAFEGVSIWSSGAFATPLGELKIAHEIADALRAASPLIHDRPVAHAREHSLEMQTPFLAALAPRTPIVPLVMGHQTRDTATAIGDALATVLDGRRALLIASSDLSHFHDAQTATALDAQVIAHVGAFDADGLMAQLEARHDHACGGGPMVSVMRAAKRLGATRSEVLRYADSGDVSGDKSSVVGYLAAAFWR